MKTILSVTAHPDDEVLGFGATAAKLSSRGNRVVNCILSGKVDVRQFRPELDELNRHILNAQKILQCDAPIIGDFPNIRFNTVPHHELVKFIEDAIEKVQPDIIFTHYPHDLNNDHYQVSIACQAAARLFQRRQIKPVESLYFMEVLSSTEWGFPAAFNAFAPDAFIEIDREFLELKIMALEAYIGVMRAYPHPRSCEVLRGLAAFRGSQAGLNYAESFKTAMNILSL
ncbi:MAG: PIG-L family deacetylase [Dysgonamonadaceae bacterium]|jgi:LmbE family N-acetylglucosaminyl deacetylase|nr:PIG-L family deacetylase [Dysgonamonadaceae bacterium]